MKVLRAALMISLNELRRLRSHKEIVVFGLALPAIIITLVGLTFGTTGSIDIGILDRDDSAASAALTERFRDVDGVVLQEYDDLDQLRIDVRTTAIQTGLVIPLGYGEAVEAGAASVEVVVDPNAEGVASALATVEGAVGEQGVEAAAVVEVERATGDPALARRVVAAQVRTQAPVEVRDLAVLGSEVETGAFSHTVPGNLVLFVFINTFVISTILAFDRKSGIVGRMLSTPTRPGAILLGLGASKLAFALLQSAILIGLGTVAFGVVWGDPLGAVALVVVFAALSTAIGLLVGSWVTNAEQAQAIGIPLSVGAGMLGGCMWPLDIVPRPMQIVGHVTPHAWAMDGWEELIFEGASFGGIAPNLAVLLGMTVLVAPLAARRLRKSAGA